MSGERLNRAFFDRPTDIAAEALVGCELFRRTDDGLVGGTIVETEAYGGPDDPASHAALYPKSRAAVMASPPGTVYVYRSYGIHHCLNVVAKPDGKVGAVLIRAVEPTLGIELMRRRRGPRPHRDLCRGPGRVCEAFAIDVDNTLTDIVERDDLWLEARSATPVVERSPRVGISRAVEVEWRFFHENSRFVSKTRARAS